MHLYFGGGEQSSWVKLLEAQSVSHVSLSFVGLTRRTKRLDSWKISEHFSESTKVFLDSGAYSVNKDPGKYAAEKVEALAQGYLAFVANNLDRIEMASEFDADAMGQDWLVGMREDFWEPDVGDKFLPIWKGSDAQGLREYAERYDRVGVLQPDNDMMLAPVVNRIVQDKGTRFHGIAMTRLNDMQQVRFDSVGSTSWLSPTQYGDTFVWDGRELHRYPKDYKGKGRESHKTYLTDQGFDAEAISAGNSSELLKLSIWSWQQFVKFRSYDATHPAPVQVRQELDEEDKRVTPLVIEPFPGAREIVKDAVAQLLPETRNDELAVPPGKKLLPVIGVGHNTTTETDEEGNETEVSTPYLKAASGSLLRCNNCFIQDKCPSFTPGNECAYEIPIAARTTVQRDNIEDTMIEIQSQRVLMLRMIEQVNGGYPDPNLGPEIDRLNRMLNKKAEREAKRNSPSAKITIEATGSGGGGLISGLFGKQAGEKLHTMEAPQPVAEIMKETDIVDAELVDDGEQ